MEPVLTRLATTGERRSIAADLVARGAARSAPHAASRMREVARLIAGEHSTSPAIVAERAVAALARLAMHAPLTERPAVTLSLSLAASALRAAPSLAIAAGLSGLEVDDLLALDALIREQPEAERSVGAPPSDRARAERRWAAGRRAVACGAVRDDIDPMITAILRRVDRALVALDDAQIDAERHPAPRAAAALTAVVQTGGGLPDAVGTAPDRPPGVAARRLSSRSTTRSRRTTCARSCTRPIGGWPLARHLPSDGRYPTRHDPAESPEIQREILQWGEMGEATKALATAIHADDYRPDVVLAIARGGLIVAAALAYALGVKNTYTMNVEFYTGVDERLPVPMILPPAPDLVDLEGAKVLIADDVADTGATLALVKEFSSARVGEVRCATLYEKSHSTVKCEYVWRRTDDWIVFPWSAEPALFEARATEA